MDILGGCMGHPKALRNIRRSWFQFDLISTFETFWNVPLNKKYIQNLCNIHQSQFRYTSWSWYMHFHSLESQPSLSGCFFSESNCKLSTEEVILNAGSFPLKFRNATWNYSYERCFFSRHNMQGGKMLHLTQSTYLVIENHGTEMPPGAD